MFLQSTMHPKASSMDGPKRLLNTLLPIALTIVAIFTAWKGMRAITSSSHPVMVVSSESMEPALYRGDLILLWNRQQIVDVGDIPVVWFPGRSLPMVHRTIAVYNQSDDQDGKTRQLILTKGDNNQFDDSFFYPAGQDYVHREDIIGLVRGRIPYLGWVALILRENPAFLYLAATTLFAVGIRG